MRSKNRLLLCLFLLPALLVASSAQAAAAPATTVVVGSKRFTDSYILGELVRQTLVGAEQWHRRALALREARPDAAGAAENVIGLSEIDVFEALAARDAEAKAKGVMLLPGAARHEHRPICKAALSMTVHFEKLVSGFSRYHKYTLGTELREGSRAVVQPGAAKLAAD